MSEPESQSTSPPREGREAARVNEMQKRTTSAAQAFGGSRCPTAEIEDARTDRRLRDAIFRGLLSVAALSLGFRRRGFAVPLQRRSAPSRGASRRLGEGTCRSALLLTAVSSFVGCGAPETVPATAKKREEARDFAERAAQMRSVRDPQGRFDFDLKSWSPVVIDVLPGYVKVSAEVALNQKLHCFVFETPIEAGAAMSRAMDSLSMGAQLQVEKLPEVEQIRGEPLIELEFDYVSTMPPKDSGSVLTLLLASADYPMVCSYEATSDLTVGRSEARRAMSSFRRLCEGGAACPPRKREFELWRVSGASHRGFLLQERLPDGEGWLSFARSATFELDSGELSCLDRLSVERTDELGLSLGRWVALRDGRVELRAQLERQEPAAVPSLTEEGSVSSAPSSETDAFASAGGAAGEGPSSQLENAGMSYRYGIERGLERGQGSFSASAALSDSVQFSWELLMVDVPTVRFLYAPLLNPSEATPVELSALDDARSLRVWRGPDVDRCTVITRAPGLEPTWTGLEDCELLKSPSLERPSRMRSSDDASSEQRAASVPEVVAVLLASSHESNASEPSPPDSEEPSSSEGAPPELAD